MVPDGSVVVPEAAAADELASFWDRAFTEFNVAKAMAGGGASQGSAWAGVSSMAADIGVLQQMGSAEERKVRAPESISYETFAHCLLQGLEMNAEEDARCWGELQEILHGCARGSTTDMNELLVEPSSASSEAKRANAPRKVIEAGMEEVAEDPRRRGLYRLWMARKIAVEYGFQATSSKDAVLEYMT